MPAFTFAPADGQARYYSDRGSWFQPGEIADWPEPPDPHWSAPDTSPIAVEPASTPKKGGGK
jgi:hypothetical protein